MGEGEGLGDGLGFIGCDGEGAGVGVEVVGGDGISVAVAEGVGLGVVVWRLQSHSSRIAAIAALSLQKSRKGRSEKQFICGRARTSPGLPKRQGVVASLAKGLLGSASREAGSTVGFKQAETARLAVYQLAREITRQVGSWDYARGHETVPAG